jgi:hypothetical protein
MENYTLIPELALGTVLVLPLSDPGAGLAITNVSATQLFLERARVYPTFRNPIPTVSPSDNPVHDLPLEAPLPLPDTVFTGDPPPDRGVTQEPWPHGQE